MGRMISTELLARIVAEAAVSPGVEVCGLLLGRGGHVEEARPSRNVAADPSCMFEIDPAALIAAHRAARAGGPAILGCYHSHPSGSAEPSARDAADAVAEGWLWAIVAGDGVRVWRAVAGGPVWGRFEEVC
ncbi:M67 family metallopeptidase [Sphingomonas bacterium]|uniref:M67 family metallopeptidase n=1 Tax=Sphingomonas bacterium TaxID=1895847 RepID=UPI00157690D1|nr:M67 family metallopeptidase [Sphingomonas bacterium]